MKGGLIMAKIAVIITDMFEDSEYSEPVAAFKKAGHEIVHVGMKSGTTVRGIKKNTPVVIDKAVEGISISEFDALLIPGGYSPDGLRIDPEAVRFAREFVESGKPVFAICHAPQLLITARVLKGRKIAGWKSVRQDIINAGAEFIDKEVVEDGNIISSRSPADLAPFIKACLVRLSP
jgi:protease I